ncbi:MAG TPA: dihydrofolate reductase family protein [Nodularia sp. (in: cyanobacteria)]|nr:dihydrofolate reductase family protein [Nodularia sp. (in: cyanobacteria)]
MPEIILYIATSLDSFIATPDGGYDWLPAIDLEGKDYEYQEFFNSIDAVLIGSTTYEQILQNNEEWPYENKPTWVFSQRQLTPANSNVKITSKSPKDVVSELADHEIKRAWLVGGAAITAAFREQRLISKYIIFISPIILGSGISLFSQSNPIETLDLVDSKSHPGGVLELVYVPQKTPK